jgi:hypothetical protein
MLFSQNEGIVMTISRVARLCLILIVFCCQGWPAAKAQFTQQDVESLENTKRPLRGHLTVRSKSHANPKAEENQRVFTNGRLHMDFASDGQSWGFLFQNPFAKSRRKATAIGIPR